MFKIQPRRTFLEFKNVENQQVQIEHDQLQMNTLVYLRDCTNCEFRIGEEESKFTKLIAENCSGVTVHIKALVVAGMVDLIRCRDIHLHSARVIPTVSVDMTTNGSFTFKNDQYRDNLCKFVITEVNNFEIKKQIGDEPAVVIGVANAAAGESAATAEQLICSYVLETDSWVTEHIVREGVGYAYTESEHKEHIRRDEQLSQQMTNFLQTQLTFSNKNEQNATTSSAPAAGKVAGSLRKLKRKPDQEDDDDDDDILVIEEQLPKPGLNSKYPAPAKFGSDEADSDIQQFMDSEEVFSAKVVEVAQIMKSSGLCVVYTGAGISTSAKLPDYRGPEGVWTLKDKGQESKKTLNFEQAEPTHAHQILNRMVKQNLVKHIVSTNVDGLHRRSGVAAENLSELHGNCYLEVCDKCHKQYLRDFDCTKSFTGPATHLTGRTCEDPNCGGALKDSIIHFGESLPEDQIKTATKFSKKADLALVLGTSMKVSPANLLPLQPLKKPDAQMVIVNLQKTAYDQNATVRVFSKCDEFMERLVAELAKLEVVV